MRLNGWGRDALFVWRPEADNGGGTQRVPEVVAAAGETPDAPTPTVEELQKTLAETQAKLKSVNAESAERRKKLQELEAAEQARKTASMTEQEQAKAAAEAAQKAAAAATAELREARREAALAKVAVKHGIDTDLLGKLVSVEFDDAGMPVNVEAAVNEALDKWPTLKPVAGGGANPTNPGRKAALTIEDVKKMSQDEVNLRWDEVQGVLAAGR